MKLLIAFFTLFIFNQTAMADVTGQWIGWIDWTFQGSGTRCDSHLNLSEDSGKLHRQGGFVDCGIVTMDMNDLLLSKIGEKLFIEEVEAGDWSENHFEWIEIYSPEVKIKNTITVKGNSMDYHEEWYQQDGRLMYDLKGRFFRK